MPLCPLTNAATAPLVPRFLLFHFLIVVTLSQPPPLPPPSAAAEEKCPRPDASDAHAFAISADCRLFIAPTAKIQLLEKRLQEISRVGPCIVWPTTGVQRPLTITLPESRSLAVLYHSTDSRTLRIVIVPDDSWTAANIVELDIRKLEVLGTLSSSIQFDSCIYTDSSGPGLRCYRIGPRGTPAHIEVYDIVFGTAFSETVTRRIELPGSAIADHLPISVFASQEQNANILVPHTMKWLWLFSDNLKKPSEFSVVKIPTQVSSASIPRFAVPLHADEAGISTAVCDRKTPESSDCMHHFTNLSSSQAFCLLRTPSILLAGVFFRHLRAKLRFVRNAQRQTVESTQSGASNSSYIIEGAPINIKTEVKVEQGPQQNSWPLAMVAIVFFALLLLVILLLLLLLCCYWFRVKRNEKDVATNDTGKTSHHNATTSDIERLIQALNATHLSATHHGSPPRHRSAETGTRLSNDSVTGHTYVQHGTSPVNVTPERRPQSVLSAPRRSVSPTVQGAAKAKDKKSSAEKPNKVKVRVTLKEDEKDENDAKSGAQNSGSSKLKSGTGPASKDKSGTTKDTSQGSGAKSNSAAGQPSGAEAQPSNAEQLERTKQQAEESPARKERSSAYIDLQPSPRRQPKSHSDEKGTSKVSMYTDEKLPADSNAPAPRRKTQTAEEPPGSKVETQTAEEDTETTDPKKKVPRTAPDAAASTQQSQDKSRPKSEEQTPAPESQTRKKQKFVLKP